MSTRDDTGRSVTMQDIAREVGVSVASVSYAVNGREGLIGDETRRKILETAQRLDYQPNQLMKAIRTRRSEVVGVLLPSFKTTFFPSIVDGIETALAERGYHAVMCQTHSDDTITEENLNMLRQRRVDGLIATPKYDQSGLYAPLVEAGIKLVFIDASLPDLPVPSVQSDDVEGARQAVRHLIAQGHRRIATLRLPDHHLHDGMRGRFSGYCEALTEAGIAVDDALIGIGTGSLNDPCVGELAAEILSQTDATAFFAPTDLAAFGVLRAGRRLGRSIPWELAIAGYSNQEAGEYTSPTLTTVDQKPVEIGRVAVQRLLAMIDGRRAMEPQRCLVRPELLVRQSSLTMQAGEG